MNTFTNRLKDLRTSNNYTQQDMTDKLNQHGFKVGRTAYQAYESGRVKPSNELAFALADIFNTSVDYLFGKNDLDNFIITEDKKKQSYVPDVKRHLEFLLSSMNDNLATYDNGEINETMKKVLITSIEQAIKVADATKR